MKSETKSKPGPSKVSQNESCKICRLMDSPEADRDVVYRDEYWNIRHSDETNILGYFIIEPRRHFLDLSHANDAECVSYGPLLSRLMSVIRSLVEVERVYTFSLAATVEHYHLHVIPRAPSFPRAYSGRGIMQYPLVPGPAPALVDEICQRARKKFARLKTHHPQS